MFLAGFTVVIFANFAFNKKNFNAEFIHFWITSFCGKNVFYLTICDDKVIKF
jgi:hypothetical protein